MMKWFAKTLLFAIVVLFYALSAFAESQLPPKPAQATFANDFAAALKPEEVFALDRKLYSYEQKTGNELVIVIVKSTKPDEIAEYSFKLGRAWGIGKKDKNNGVLLLWAPEDRAVFIATGYGVEGDLTDALSKRIIEQIILPEFKAGNYYQGLDKGTDAIIGILSGDVPQTLAQDESAEPGISIFIIFFLIFFVLPMFFRRRRNSAFLLPFMLGSNTFSSGGRSSFRGGFGGGSFGGGGAGGRY